MQLVALILLGFLGGLLLRESLHLARGMTGRLGRVLANLATGIVLLPLAPLLLLAMAVGLLACAAGTVGWALHDGLAAAWGGLPRPGPAGRPRLA